VSGLGTKQQSERVSNDSVGELTVGPSCGAKAARRVVTAVRF
jgi:hypothetical protein